MLYLAEQRSAPIGTGSVVHLAVSDFSAWTRSEDLAPIGAKRPCSWPGPHSPAPRQLLINPRVAADVSPRMLCLAEQRSAPTHVARIPTVPRPPRQGTASGNPRRCASRGLEIEGRRHRSECQQSGVWWRPAAASVGRAGPRPHAPVDCQPASRLQARSRQHWPGTALRVSITQATTPRLHGVPPAIGPWCVARGRTAAQNPAWRRRRGVPPWGSWHARPSPTTATVAQPALRSDASLSRGPVQSPSCGQQDTANPVILAIPHQDPHRAPPSGAIPSALRHPASAIW